MKRRAAMLLITTTIFLATLVMGHFNGGLGNTILLELGSDRAGHVLAPAYPGRSVLVTGQRSSAGFGS